MVELVNMEPMEVLTLIDAENNKQFQITVNREDGETARRDMGFATLLLERAKKNILQPTYLSCAEVATIEPSTSTSNSSSRSNNLENNKDTHIWGKDETLFLISLYSEFKEDFYNGKYTVKHQWEKIAKIMQEKGYDVTGFKCCTKFQSLKRAYKTVVDHNNRSGNNPKKWEYFQIMQELFRDKPWVQPMTVAGSHIDTIEEEKEDDLSEKRIKKQKLNTIIEQYISHNKEEQKRKAEIRKEQHNEKVLVLQRIENLIERLIEKTD